MRPCCSVLGHHVRCPLVHKTVSSWTHHHIPTGCRMLAVHRSKPITGTVFQVVQMELGAKLWGVQGTCAEVNRSELPWAHADSPRLLCVPVAQGGMLCVAGDADVDPEFFRIAMLQEMGKTSTKQSLLTSGAVLHVPSLTTRCCALRACSIHHPTAHPQL